MDAYLFSSFPNLKSYKDLYGLAKTTKLKKNLTWILDSMLTGEILRATPLKTRILGFQPSCIKSANACTKLVGGHKET